MDLPKLRLSDIPTETSDSFAVTLRKKLSVLEKLNEEIDASDVPDAFARSVLRPLSATDLAPVDMIYGLDSSDSTLLDPPHPICRAPVRCPFRGL